MEKLDLRKQWKQLYEPSAKAPGIVDVPEFQYLMVTDAVGAGYTPGDSPAFLKAVESLYAVAYGLKFMVKKRAEDPIDYGVMPLEALWWVEDGHFDLDQPGNWFFQAMIMQPDLITPEMFAQAAAAARKKKGGELAEVRLERYQEGLCVQMMHLGPYKTEPATIETMDQYALTQKYQLLKHHHEIYLSDPTRTAPEKMKTVLRRRVQAQE